MSTPSPRRIGASMGVAFSQASTARTRTMACSPTIPSPGEMARSCSGDPGATVNRGGSTSLIHWSPPSGLMTNRNAPSGVAKVDASQSAT